MVEYSWRSKIFVHFASSEADAGSIVGEKKLRTSSYQGREDRIFAVDLDETLRNDRVQFEKGVFWGVLFTTSEADVVNPFRNEVYWYASHKDEKGGYLPLDLAIKLDCHDVHSARELLNSISPEWGEPDDSKH